MTAEKEDEITGFMWLLPEWKCISTGFTLKLGMEEWASFRHVICYGMSWN